jgi:outer membrane receptor protein involved in Fe transport
LRPQNATTANASKSGFVAEPSHPPLTAPLSTDDRREIRLQRFDAFVRKYLAVLPVIGCLFLLVPTARADDVADEADVQFSLGTERYQARDYERALAYFLASNRLARNRNVLFNIARCYEQLRQFPEAYRYYTRALDGETDDAAVARTNEAIARISPRVAVLRIVTDPPGARIYLDRKDLGERGTGPQRMALPPATYRVIAELEGYEDATSDPVDVRVGVERSVSLVLRRIVGTIRIPGPAGAAVRLDADNAPEACRTPCDVLAPPGQHTVILTKPGYRTVRVPISVGADQLSSIQPDLLPETGSLVVNSDERDAAIEVDGYTQGFTPAILTVPIGLHRIRVNLRGFRPVEREVVIRASEQTRLEVQLVSSDSVEAASRLSEPVEEAPASVSLVSSQEIRAMRYPTLAEAVRGVRGIYLSDDRGYETLGFRGFSRPGSYGNRVLITLDGVPLNDDWVWSSYVGYDVRTDLEDIDRIEVVRGPGSVVYGTSAFSGVVNMVTRSKEVPTGREIGTSVASDGVARARARITQHFGPSGGVWTSVAAGQSAGRDFFFPEYVADGPPAVAGNARGVDGARFATLTGRAWFKDLSLAWSLHHHNKHMPTGQFDTLLGDSRTHQADTRGFVEARFEPMLGKSVTSLTRLHANVYAYRGILARSPQDGGVETDEFDSYWVGAEQRFVLAPSPAFSASLGGEAQTHPHARQSNATEVGGVYFADVEDFVLAAVYGSLDLRPVSGLKLSAGGRLDYYSTFGSSLNPRFAVIIQPYPGGNLKILAGKAFKAPSIYELSYRAIGQLNNPELKPENIYSGEIEWSHRISPTVIATAAVYTNYITDLISLQNVPGSDNIQFQNTATPVGTIGGEVEVRRDWKEGWMVSASYSIQRSAYLASGSAADLLALNRSPDYREVPNAPTHLASIKGAAPILSRALTVMSRLSLEGQRFDTNDLAASDTVQLRTENAFLWDLVFTGTEARWGLNYSVGVYNAFDSRARYPVSTEFRQRSIAITGRSFLAALTLTF